MSKFILLAATHMNWGMIRRDCGEWLRTKYVVYSEGTCWTVSEYDEDPHNESVLSSLPERVRRQMCWERMFRMDEAVFRELKSLLETQFDGVEAGVGNDGEGWKMHHYGPGGKRLHSVRGCVFGSPVLERIAKLLSR